MLNLERILQTKPPVQSGTIKHLLESKDWSKTPLGPRSQWPETLRVAVNVMMDSQLPMFVAWGPERIFIYNDAYAVILGEKHPAALGMRFEDLWSEIWNDLLPLIQSVDRGEPVYVEDMRLVMHRYGYDEETYFTFSYSPIRNETDQVYGLYCACFETTRKVLSERALQKTEAQFKGERNRLLNILENFPEPITLIKMPDLVYEFTNVKYRDFYLNGKDVIGKKITEILPEGEEQGFINLLETVYKTGNPFRGNEIPVELRNPDGTLRKLVLNIVYEPVRGPDGNVEAILAGNFDVTELVLAKERAQIANTSKTTFLANMSHEIRTPMSAVLGFTEILRDPKLSEDQKLDALDRIERSGQSLLKIIDDILDISKVESGKLRVEKIQFSPLEIVSEVVALLRLQAEQKAISIKTVFSPHVPEFASSDPARVRQILTNLVGNAIKFTDSGSVTIEVDAQLSNAKEGLIFKVTDTGIGLSKEDQARIFQPFAQADDAITRKFGGTGLGLALSKRLAEQLGGDLSLASSEVGKGSQFVVRIDAGPFTRGTIQDSKLSQRGKISAPTVKPSARLDSICVLVVDDVLDNQVLLRKYLESSGAKVEVANNGQEAIEKASGNSYDVVLMDIQMPVVDGIQATKELRAQGYKKPILALTAHAMKSDVERSLEAGCDEHLTKPITRGDLVQAVGRYLK